jgi:medium-chain acyl-[acyl-carrier-protein] hydrolase
LKRLDGTPAALFDHPEMMRFLLSVYRADLELGETRKIGAVDPFPFPIAAYGGEGDPDVSPEDLDAWNQHTLAHFRRRLFRGGHFYLKTSAPDVLSSLASDLIEASSPAGRPLLA